MRLRVEIGTDFSQLGMDGQWTGSSLASTKVGRMHTKNSKSY